MTQNKTLKTILITFLFVGLLFSCKSKTPENNENPSNSSIKIKNIAKMLLFSLFFSKGYIIIATFVGEMNEALR